MDIEQKRADILAILNNESCCHAVCEAYNNDCDLCRLTTLHKLGVRLVDEDADLPLIKAGGEIALGAAGDSAWGVEIRTPEESKVVEELLISEQEYQDCNGDNEEMLIRQHNKSNRAAQSQGWRKTEPMVKEEK